MTPELVGFVTVFGIFAVFGILLIGIPAYQAYHRGYNAIVEIYDEAGERQT